MPRRKPTLGYPTRTAACMALNDQGLTSRQIADRIGIEQSTVAALIASGRGTNKPYDGNARTVVIEASALDALEPAAVRRGLSVNALVRRLIYTIIDDDMVDAILDDGDAP